MEHIYAEDDVKNNCYTEIASSEDQPVMIPCAISPSQHVSGDSVTLNASDGVQSFSQDGHLLRSSSYEDIYIGTKLPGDEPSAGKDAAIDASEIGDRFDARPASTAFSRQPGGKSSSFENLYELQGENAGERVTDDVMEIDSVASGVQHWQIRESGEDFSRYSDRDSVLTSVHSRNADEWNSSPIDITVESGLDKVGQSTGSGKRMAARLQQLQHSMSYDVEMNKRHQNVTSVSSLDGDDGRADFQRESNTTSGIRNGCRWLHSVVG